MKFESSTGVKACNYQKNESVRIYIHTSLLFLACFLLFDFEGYIENWIKQTHLFWAILLLQVDAPKIQMLDTYLQLKNHLELMICFLLGTP